jgi:hypothetical protein
MSTATGGRVAARIGTALVVMLALALVASMCTSSDDGTGPLGSTPIDPSGTGEILALGPPGEPVSVRLSAGTAQAGTDPDPIQVVEGTPLDDDTVAAIFDRLPEWLRPDEDRLDFNRPAETLKPPLVGDTIEVPFPAGTDDPVPPVPGGPLEVLRFQPEGPVDVAPFISITFNQPMVPLATLEQLDALEVPVIVTPEMPGRWQWIGTRTLRFEHQPDLFDRLPMATEYRVEIPAGTTSQTGGALSTAVSWTFNTPPVQVQSFEPGGDSLPLEPIFLVVADQRIDPAAVLETITLTADGDEKPLRLATDAEVREDERIGNRVDGLLEGRWLAFRAVDAFEPDRALVIRVGPDTPSAEGPRPTTVADTYTARTYAPLRIDDWSCRGEDRCEPGRSLYISFNNPLDLDAFDPAMVGLEPELAGMTVHAEYSSISIRGATVGGTTYTATVSKDLTDIYGQTLGKDDAVEFEIDDARPFLNQFNRRLITLDPLAPDPSLAVTTVNHDELRVRLFRVEVDDWPSYVSYQDQRWDERQPAPPSSWEEVSNTTIDTRADANQLTETTVELGDALDGKPGHIVVLVEPTGRLARLSRDDNDYWSNRPTVVWAQSTVIGSDVFSDDDELLVWATDLRSGEPLAGVEVGLMNTAGTATTNTDGLAGLSPPSSSSELTRPLVARRGDDSAILDSSWHRSDRSDRSVWYVFDDRKMYRPGETASFKGWVRRLTLSDDAQLAAVGDNARINYRAGDWYGNEIGSGTVDLNSLGGFDFQIEIPAGANLGQAWIDLSLAGVSGLENGHNHSFQIQEFRRPEFEVTTRAESAGPYIVGNPATVAVEAAYFSGGPLPNADVEWTVTTRQATYSPPNWDDFTFGVWIPWWYSDFFLGGDSYYEDEYIGGFGPQFDPETVETFSGKTDAGGTHYLRMDFGGDGEGLPTTVTSQATVFDVNRQAWADGTDLLVHPGELYVGLRSDRTFVEAGEPIVIEAIATDIDGTAVTGRTITLTAGRLEWKILEGSWQETPVEIETCSVTSAERGVECSFATDIGGTYQIAAVIADDAGRSSKTEITRWVSGGNRRPERNVVQEEVTLIPDRQEYAPGTNAEILVEAPFSPARGLLTISRNGIIETQGFTIEDAATVLSIPIEDEYTPNVHIQIDLVGATGRTADNGDPLPDAPDRPAFAVGRLNLQVPPLSRTLEVTAVPADPTTEPGNTTRVDVTVTNSSGNPVAGAELAVVVVDEAVLALTAYELPDPLDIFYRPIDSRVSSRYQRRSIELTNPELLDEEFETWGATTTTAAAAGGGGDGDDGTDAALRSAIGLQGYAADESAAGNGQGDAIDVRTNFDALAVFEPGVRTGPDGAATVPSTVSTSSAPPSRTSPPACR